MFIFIKLRIFQQQLNIVQPRLLPAILYCMRLRDLGAGGVSKAQHATLLHPTRVGSSVLQTSRFYVKICL